ncbi:ATP-binding protein [Palleronia sp. KMU-117]|uniref:ATP-binding protein n=1 Tax=Palleronia sp. KMU-117 TaxID=3434108 RepID=UPI003D715C5A
MPDDRPVFRQSIDATHEEVRSALSGMIRAMSPLELSQEESGSVELVVAEALNNIVEHAYVGVKPGRIDISVVAACDGLHCCLRDSGSPMPDGRPPIGAYAGPAPVLDDQPEGGFGWFLIRSLARELDYRRADDQNVLTFRIAVRGHSAAA